VDVTILHVVRSDDPHPGALAEDDWIVYRGRDGAPWSLDRRGTPPIAPGPIDHAHLVTLAAAADRVIVW
jgi:hypothetical protein